MDLFMKTIWSFSNQKSYSKWIMMDSILVILHSIIKHSRLKFIQTPFHSPLNAFSEFVFFSFYFCAVPLASDSWGCIFILPASAYSVCVHFLWSPLLINSVRRNRRIGKIWKTKSSLLASYWPTLWEKYPQIMHLENPALTWSTKRTLKLT